MGCRFGYDEAIIVLNILELCLSGVASGLLGSIFQPIEVVEIPIKLQIVYATLVGCMVVNLIMILAIALGSKSTIHLWLRALLSTVGAAMLITSGVFLLDQPNDPANDESNDESYLISLSAGIIMIVNSAFYILDALIIVRFYLYTLFCDDADY